MAKIGFSPNFPKSENVLEWIFTKFPKSENLQSDCGRIEGVPGVQLQFCLARFVALDETNKAVRKTTRCFGIFSRNLARSLENFWKMLRFWAKNFAAVFGPNFWILKWICGKKFLDKIRRQTLNSRTTLFAYMRSAWIQNFIAIGAREPLQFAEKLKIAISGQNDEIFKWSNWRGSRAPIAVSLG